MSARRFTALSSLLASIPLAFKRLRSHLLLSVAVTTGLTAAVALATAIPLYADSVSHRMLLEQLSGDQARPPFAFLFRYVGAWNGPLEWEDIQAADAYLTTQAANVLGLPPALNVADGGPVVRHVRTDKWQLFPGDESAYAGRQPLEWIALGFLDGLNAHVTIEEGEPLPESAPPHVVPVLASRALANRLGLQVGETYLLVNPSDADHPLSLQIAGIWQPADAASHYWLYPPRSFEDVLLTSETAFRDQVAPAVKKEVGLVAWYLVADGAAVTSSTVPHLLSRIAALRARLSGLLAGAALDLSPEEPLSIYRQNTVRLTLVLYAFGIPIVGLVLYFVTLVAGMTTRRQQGETVVLRSRGGAKSQIVGLYLLQWSLLGLAALALGWPLGWAAATAMGHIRSFLDFGAGQGVPIRPDWSSLRFGILAVLVSILAAVLPALASARYTIVTHQQELERTLRRPWWQRYLLDLGLLIPTLYGYILLRRPGRLPLARLTQGDIFANPVLFIVPTLFILSWALLLLRFLPRLMEGLARMSRGARGSLPLLIFHDLSHQVGHIAGPLLLLMLTTALATFSASLALTLDGHLHDRVYYRVGADLRLAEGGEFIEQNDRPATPGGSTPPSGDESEGWAFLPIAEHRELPGVRAAVRVGNYAATASLGGRVETGRLIGLDRLDFPGVAFFRADFAPQSSLIALMNALAGDRRALLVDRRFLARYGLQPGDPLNLTVDVWGERAEIEFVVAGALDLFPSVYPEDGPYFVGNLRYLFERLGGLYPYDVWLATAPGSTEAIIAALNARGVAVSGVWDARSLIAAEQQRPQRQGLFGLLTLGFLAAGLLTIVGLALHTLLSFRERTVELGVLRVLGLSLTQMRLYLAGGLLSLLLIGLLAGTALGMATGQLFIPFLQAESGLYPDTPPLIIRTAWENIALIYVLFAAMTGLSLGVTQGLLQRMRVYEAIKMGETL
ncbi:MAG: FtsX-like permease family protein [Anaerolineae bacterium]|nr:FtsX-like permease family protein [Anaerolineae bacterium]